MIREQWTDGPGFEAPLTDPWAQHPIVNRKTVCSGGGGIFSGIGSVLGDVIGLALAPETGGLSLAIPALGGIGGNLIGTAIGGEPFNPIGALTAGAGGALGGLGGGFDLAGLGGEGAGAGSGALGGFVPTDLGTFGAGPITDIGAFPGQVATDIGSFGGAGAGGVGGLASAFNPAGDIAGSTSLGFDAGSSPIMPSVASPTGFSASLPDVSPLGGVGGGGGASAASVADPFGTTVPGVGDTGGGFGGVGAGGAPGSTGIGGADFGTASGGATAFQDTFGQAAGTGGTAAGGGSAPALTGLEGGFTSDAGFAGVNPALSTTVPGGGAGLGTVASDAGGGGGIFSGITDFLRRNKDIIGLGTGIAGVGNSIMKNAEMQGGIDALKKQAEQAQMFMHEFQGQYQQLAQQSLNLIQQGASGNVTPGMAANLLATANRMKTQIQAKYAQMGASGGSNEQQDLNNVDLLISGLQGSMAQSILNSGVQLAGSANQVGGLGAGSFGSIGALANIGLQSDQDLSSALSGLARAAA